MEAKEQSCKQAEDLYRLAFLFTGDRELSVNLVIETINRQDSSKALFTTGLQASSRKVFITKALACISNELSLSAAQMASEQMEEVISPAGWSLNPNTTKARIEQVLLAMDIFPRCALLLTVFEGINLEDAAIFMGADPELVLTGQVTGLRDLTCRLAKMEGWHPSSQVQPVESELRHAY